jgi:hypothetical protein
VDQHPVADLRAVGAAGHQGHVDDASDAGDVHSCKEPLGIAELDDLTRDR